MNIGLRFQAHPSSDRLEMYARGALAPDWNEAVDAHLGACARCRSVVLADDEFLHAWKAFAISTRPERAVVPPTVWMRARRIGSSLGTVRTVGWASALAAIFLVCLPMLRDKAESVTAPQRIKLISVRSAEGTTIASSSELLDLEFDVADLSPGAAHEVEIVDSVGHLAWHGTPSSSPGRLAARVPALRAGVYWVRLNSASGELLREFGLRLE